MYKIGLYPERRESIEGLSLEDKGKILENIFYYSTKGEIPHNSYIGVIFNFMKNRIDADRGEYENRCQKNREIALEREEHKRERKSTNVHERSQDSTTSTNSNSNSNVSKDTIPPNPQGEKENLKLKCDTTAEKFLEQRNNVQVFMKCRELTTDIKNIWRDVCKKYTKEQITKGVKGYYDDILARDKNSSYASHRFSLYEFLKQGNGLKRFINK